MKKMSIMAAMLSAVLVASAQDIKLAVQAYTFRDRSFTETVATAKKLGIKYIEMYPGQKLGGELEGNTDYNKIAPETVTKLKKFIDDAGVKVVSYGVTGAGSEEQWDKMAAFAHAIGIKTIQIEASEDRGKFDLAEKMAEKHDLTIAIHNHRQECGAPEGVLKQLEGRGARIGAGCDIGHWMRRGVTPLDGVKLLKGKFVTMHLVDVEKIVTDGKSRDVPYGTGAGNLKAVLDELKSQGFKGYVTLEYEHMSPTLEDEVGQCVAWFNKYQAGTL
ncbi:MAG: sugar phosphate isomerase/epimerase [Kiritimatiellae bacterium]|nr:sugar phosphate isomerase/epimerase [Kiritimatiellia bacterium]